MTGLLACVIASWYGYGDSKLTATGAKFNPMAMTAAHRTLPFGTVLDVTDKVTGRKVTVTVNDRGPYIAGRGIDLTYAAFKAISDTNKGVTEVCLVKR